MIRPFVFALLLGFAAALAACGGSSETSDLAPTPTSAPATTAASPTVEPSPAGAPSPVPAATPTAVPPPITTSPDDRIVIPSIGVDAALVAFLVPPDGVMQDPRPNVGVYDFGNFPQFGGRPGEGNLIVAGNIGNNDGPFGSYDNFGKLAPGHAVSLNIEGETYEYTVVVRCSARRSDFVALIMRTPYEALTITQNVSDEGDAALGGQRYVIAEREPGSVPAACPAGEQR